MRPPAHRSPPSHKVSTGPLDGLVGVLGQLQLLLQKKCLRSSTIASQPDYDYFDVQTASEQSPPPTGDMC